ncbi:MAG: septal ring lytic transglycosylase RlpA family protein [Candidatus Omnitrophica bacterium]|nr:septal ring lytic transglycosylase RlpA family protein [Candidatus Omnitrophota bacterium]
MFKKQLSLIPVMLFLAACADNTPVAGPYPKIGAASWYSAKITATGEKANDNDLTCAMRKKDFGKYYRVCNTANDKCVVVRHNNFGPSKRFYDQGRIIDLSKAAFSRIADLEEGIIEVTVGEE